MRRLLVPLALALAGALALSACDVSLTPYAAKVDGATITTTNLNDALAAVGGDAGLRCDLAASNAGAGAPTASIEGAGQGTYDATFTASQLTTLIRQRVLAAEVRSLGLRIDQEATTLAFNRLQSELTPTPGSRCAASGMTVLSELSPSYEKLLVSLEAAQDAIAAHLAGTTLSAAGLASYAAAHPNTTSLACVSAILTNKLSTAQAARAAIVGGASFATVARHDSIDPTSAANGGALGCLALSQFVSPLNTELARLPTGALSQPIAFQGNYVLVQITSRKPPTTAQALDAVVTAQSSAETALVDSALAHRRVSVDPRYGRWGRFGGSWQVAPPRGPADAQLANPGALTPPPVSLG